MAGTQGNTEEGEAKKPTEKRGEGKGQQEQTGETTRVKQVTFLDVKDDDDGPKKEPRRRIKHKLNELKSQMEFYFGDSNLNKDRFMAQFIGVDPEGYIPLSVFMGFNKIQSVTTDTDMLAKAIKLSPEFLQLNDDNTKVKRITPVKIMSPEEIDARTVYVEGFHKFISREWIHDKFSKCGQISYISIPKFKTTKEIKGFAFVEFETPEEAEKAIEMLNSVPEEQLVMDTEEKVASVKESKNLAYWKKRALREGIDPAEVEASLRKLAKEGARRKKKKNRANVTQAEATASNTTTTEKTNATDSATVPEEVKENTAKQEVAGEADETKTKKSKKAKKKRKRKAAQNVGEPETSAAQPKESETSVKTEAGESKHLKALTSVTIKQEPGEDSKPSRKRQRQNETDSQDISTKVPKFEPHADAAAKSGEKEDDEGVKQRTLDVVQNVSGTGDPGKDTNSIKIRIKIPVESLPCGGDRAQLMSVPPKAKESAPTVGENVTKKADKGKKRKTDTTVETPQEKQPKVKKQKEGKLGGESRKSLDQTAEASPGDGRKRKRKNAEGGDEASNAKKKKNNVGSESELASETEEPAAKKKKRHRKHKLPEQEMRLRVMSKATWIRLKEEYLQYQKDSMRQLKDQLKEAGQKRRDRFKNKTSPPVQETNKQNNEQQDQQANPPDATEGRPPPEFVANTVLEVKSEAELCLQTIKADIPKSVQLAYVDIRPGMTEGYIRCKDAESATKLLKTGLRGLSLSLVEGETEKEYWDKLITDRQSKLSDTKRRKRRGKLKILQRAQNPQEEMTHRQHLIFADDEDMEGNMDDESHNPQALQDDEFNTYSGRETPPHLAL